MFCNIADKVAMFFPVQYAANVQCITYLPECFRHKSFYHDVAGPCSARSSRPRVKITSLWHPLHTLHYLRMMRLFIALSFF